MFERFGVFEELPLLGIAEGTVLVHRSGFDAFRLIQFFQQTFQQRLSRLLRLIFQIALNQPAKQLLAIGQTGVGKTQGNRLPNTGHCQAGNGEQRQTGK